ncbi:MAG: 50S ribosomal protein L33 [Gammaproteobacteria bacterium]|jgi:hypothetical protein
MVSDRVKIRMNSTGVGKDGKSTGYFKTTTKKVKGVVGEKKGKLEKMMFDPRAWDAEKGKFGMYVLFKEGKISKGSKGNKGKK